MEVIGTLLFLGIIITCIALPLLVSALRHAHTIPQDTPVITWKRCVICGQYQHATSLYCLNHERPTPILPIPDRLESRARYHAKASQCWQIKPEEQDALIAYALKLEELSDEEWSTGAVYSVREHIYERELPDFVGFLFALEEAAGHRLDIDDVVTQYLVAERMEDDKSKVAQN